MSVIATIEARDIIRTILGHLGLPSEPPTPLPPRHPPGAELDVRTSDVIHSLHSVLRTGGALTLHARPVAGEMLAEPFDLTHDELIRRLLIVDFVPPAHPSLPPGRSLPV